MNDLRGRIALITGAGRHGGIGAAIAQRLAQAGVDVAIGDLCAPPPAGLPAPAIGQWDELQAIAAEIERGSVGDRPQHGGGSVGDRPQHGGGSVGDRPEHGGLARSETGQSMSKTGHSMSKTGHSMSKTGHSETCACCRCRWM
jgi:NAD(P)-dependent dehydrogenase (short-subunit alcohol dehydrogenase family)